MLAACPISSTAPPVPGDRPLLSVIIVNYRQWKNTARLVRQLRAAGTPDLRRVEIVIVDNHSPAHPLRRRLRRLPRLPMRFLKQNRGFARGVNDGVRLSRGQWILMLNPDVTVETDFVERLLESIDAESNPRLGIVGVQLRDPGGAIQGSVGRDPSFIGTIAGQLRPRAIRKCRPVSGRHRRRVSWVTGCGLLVRRDCFEQLGGFDRDYFLYYEDADLCRRARAAGWDVCHEPALCITHHSPLHGRDLAPRIRLLTRHAFLTYASKHWNAWPYFGLALSVCLEAIVRARLARCRSARLTFREMGRLAFDLLLGDKRAAYRRVWRAAQR